MLAAGALVIVAATGWYGYSLNQKIANIPRVDDGILGTNEDQRPEASRPRPSTSCSWARTTRSDW